MDIFELHKRFGTQTKCIAYLERLRWNGEKECPYCRDKDHIASRKLSSIRTIPVYHCNACNHDFTVVTKTIFQGTKMELPKWFGILATMLNAKSGQSSWEISRNLGIKQGSAWYNGMKLRCPMLHFEPENDSEKLCGEVELDITYVGPQTPRYRKMRKGKTVAETPRSKFGKGTSKIPVVAFVERGGLKRAYAKMLPKNPTGKNILELAYKFVDLKNVIFYSDEGPEFKLLGKHAPHFTVNHSKYEYVRGEVHTNTIEGFFGKFKNCIRGAFIFVTRKYLPLYLAEFAFKYSSRVNPMAVFESLIRKALLDLKTVVRLQRFSIGGRVSA